MLGSQPLTALRDLIACPNDLTVPGDLSDDPDARTRLPVAVVCTRILILGRVLIQNISIFLISTAPSTLNYCREKRDTVPEIVVVNRIIKIF